MLALSCRAHRLVRAFVAASLVAGALACGASNGGDPTNPVPAGPPTQGRFVSGDSQVVTAGDSSARPYTVRVTDADGRGVPNVTVYFTTQFDAFVRGGLTTDNRGEVALRWRPGAKPGVWVPLNAYATDSASGRTFRAGTAWGTTRVGPALRLASDGPIVTRPTPAVGDTFRVYARLVDADANAVSARVPITWTATPDGGFVQSVVTTDDSGRVAADFVVGTRAGSRTLTATGTGLDAAQFTLNVLAGPAARVEFAPSRVIFFETGEQLPVRTHAYDRFGNDATTPVTVRSAVNAVATVADGLLTAVGVGDAHVTASAGTVGATGGGLDVTVRGLIAASHPASTAGSCVLATGGTVYCRTAGTAWEPPDLSKVPTDSLLGYRPIVDASARPVAFTGMSRSGECALASGIPWCWGHFNEVIGQPAAATPVTGAPALVAIDANYDHGCGVTAGGEAWCWGIGVDGELGSRAAPMTCSVLAPCALTAFRVDGPAFRQVATGYVYGCGLTLGGAAYCWGSGGGGRLGTATPPDTCTYANGASAPCAKTPVPVETSLRFTQLAAGFSMTCGLTAAPEVWCWGTPLSMGAPATPRQLLAGQTFVEIGVTTGLVCGLTASGDVRCAIPGGTQAPKSVLPGRTVIKLAVAQGRVCGLTSGDALVCAKGFDLPAF